MKNIWKKIYNEYRNPYVYLFSFLIGLGCVYLLFKYNWIAIYPIAILCIWLILKPILQYAIYPLLKIIIYEFISFLFFLEALIVKRMEVRTKAYKPILKNGRRCISEEVVIVDKKIISMSVTSAGTIDPILPIINRLNYRIEFLDKYHTDFGKRSKRYAKIIYSRTNTPDKEEYFFIRLWMLKRFKLKWMNNII